MKSTFKKIFVVLAITIMLLVPVAFASEIVNTISGEPEMLNEVTMLGEAVQFGSNDDNVIPYDREISGPVSPLNGIIRNSILIGRYISMIGAIVFGFLAFKSFRNKDEQKPKKHIIKGTTYTIGAIGFLCANGVLSIIKSFKPVIYLYPEEEKEVTVKLGKKEKLTCTYPKYNDDWKVLAKPSGDLVELETGKELYSLYW